MVKIKQSINRITTLNCANGSITKGDEEVKAEILNFYGSLGRQMKIVLEGTLINLVSY